MRRLMIALALAATSLPAQAASPMSCSHAAMYAFMMTFDRYRGVTLEQAVNKAARNPMQQQYPMPVEFLDVETSILRDIWSHPQFGPEQMKFRIGTKCERAAENALLRD